jgi:protein-L-isoaspartate(D-aspartate) O-methyltransferase
VAPQPALFTVEFRRKMGRLSPRQRQEWLSSLSAQLEGGDPVGGPRAQELREVARGCRLELVSALARHLGPVDERHLEAVLEVPRERFVRLEDVDRSACDMPLPLDLAGHATISAPHAYLLSFALLKLAPGDDLVELGTGSGYGAALAAFIVGAQGSVVTYEIDPILAAWARRVLVEPNVLVVEGDAVTNVRQWRGASKVVATFAVDAWPDEWIDALPEGGKLVAPVGVGEQRLLLAERRDGRVVESDHGAVRYVRNRSDG